MNDTINARMLFEAIAAMDQAMNEILYNKPTMDGYRKLLNARCALIVRLEDIALPITLEDKQ